VFGAIVEIGLNSACISKYRQQVSSNGRTRIGFAEWMKGGGGGRGGRGGGRRERGEV